jgi:predicted CopG family antitoxin
VAEKYAVAITFLYPVEEQQSEDVRENIKKFREKHNKNSFIEHLKKNLIGKKRLGFNVQEVIDGNESEKNRQIRYELEKRAWEMHVADNGAKWKAQKKLL